MTLFVDDTKTNSYPRIRGSLVIHIFYKRLLCWQRLFVCFLWICGQSYNIIFIHFLYSNSNWYQMTLGKVNAAGQSADYTFPSYAEVKKHMNSTSSAQRIVRSKEDSILNRPTSQQGMQCHFILDLFYQYLKITIKMLKI